MKKFASLVLACSITLQGGAVAAGPKQQAQGVIDSSLARARSDAYALVHQDFLNAMLELMVQTQDTKDPSLAFVTYQKQMASLESQMEKLSQQIRNNQKPDMAIAKQIWESYKDMARERFGLSFKAQSELTKTNQLIEVAERTINRFESTCKAGRSEFGLSYDTVTIPNLPAANVTIMLNYGWGENGNMGSVDIASANATGANKSRSEIGAVLNTSAGVTTSVALSGSGGAAVAYAAAAAPYLVGAAIVYGIYSHFASAAEQAALQKDLVEANLLMFEQTADAKDVAGFYREACDSFVALTAGLRKVLVDIRSGEESRLLVVSNAESLKPAIEEFGVATEKHKRDSQVLHLLYNAKSDRCIALDQGVDPASAPCFATPNGFQSAQAQDLVIPLDLNESEDLLRTTKESLDAFLKAYPQEKQVELMTAQMALVFGSAWQKVESSILALSFESVDAMMAALFQKVQKVLAEARALRAAAWEDPNDPIREEQALFSQLEELRRNHRLLLSEAIGAIFNRTDKQKLIEKVRIHTQRTSDFARKYGSKSTGLRSLDSAGKRLLKIVGTI